MKNSTIFKFLAITLIMCPLFISAMEQEKTASDFEIYQLLSFTGKNNPEFCLPADIVKTIASTVCEISQEINIWITQALNTLIRKRKELNESHNNQILNYALIEKYDNDSREIKEQIAELCQNNPNLTPEIHALLKEHNELEEKHKEIQDIANQMRKTNTIYGNLLALIEENDIVDTLTLSIERSPECVYQEPPKKNSNVTASINNQENSTNAACRCSIQ